MHFLFLRHLFNAERSASCNCAAHPEEHFAQPKKKPSGNITSPNCQKKKVKRFPPRQMQSSQVLLFPLSDEMYCRHFQGCFPESSEVVRVANCNLMFEFWGRGKNFLLNHFLTMLPIILPPIAEPLPLRLSNKSVFKNGTDAVWLSLYTCNGPFSWLLGKYERKGWRGGLKFRERVSFFACRGDSGSISR